MSFPLLNDPEAAEALGQYQPQRALDLVSEALESPVFVSKRRLDLQLVTPLGRSPRLWVSRYYWDAEPPIAVDFVGDVGYGEPEVVAKRVYCRDRGIRYILLANAFDVEGIAKSRPARPVKAASGVVLNRPIVAPRRNPTKRR